jgi:deoxyribodipyrimidine photo-lyase
MKVNIFWFRRDLRLEDNTALSHALSSGLPVLPVFIFDKNINDELPADDARISFIYETLSSINKDLRKSDSSLYIRNGDPVKVWKAILVSFDINAVYINKEYEPYAIQRDKEIESLLLEKNIPVLKFKDQVIFEEKEILKADKSPYTIFTPYKNRWLQRLAKERPLLEFSGSLINQNFYHCNFDFPPREKLDFNESKIKARPYDLSVIKGYNKYRDYPSTDKTSYLGPHLRFGTVSIRKIAVIALKENAVFLSELIWREFFMQILFNFPHVVTGNFRSKFDDIPWRNNENEFEKWCRGETGYPMVDAGMRQLSKTGYMHNRVRMITAGFLCKHLLTDWRWGEAWFAGKLLDYELSSNNGNWQWAAGTGCDAAQYFRVFSPDSQQKRFDQNMDYIRKWVEDIDKPTYPKPMIDHDFARQRVITAYKSSIRY